MSYLIMSSVNKSFENKGCGFWDLVHIVHLHPLFVTDFGLARTGIFISSNLFGSIFQIASLPVVILAPLGAVSLLWNSFFARVILGDVFSPWMLLSTLCIAGGAVLIAIFGIVPEPTRSLEDLLQLFHRPAFIVYFSLLGFFTIISLIIVSGSIVSCAVYDELFRRRRPILRIILCMAELRCLRIPRLYHHCSRQIAIPHF